MTGVQTCALPISAGHPLPRPTIERSDLDETISFDRKELAKALEHADDDSKKE